MKKRTRNNLRRMFTFLLTLILGLQAVTVSGSAASKEVLPNGSYVLYTEGGTCLNVQYAKKDGGKVCVDNANLEPNEIWVLKNIGGGYVTLEAKHAPGHYLSGANGFDKQLMIRRCVPNQAVYQWLPIPVENGAYVFMNRANGYVIDCCNGANTTIGNPFLLYHRNNFTAAQSVHAIRISETATLTPSTRVTNLSASNYKVGLFNDPNQVWNAQYGVKSGAGLVCDPYNGQANEIIYIKNEGNGLYSLRFAGDTSYCIAARDVFVDSQMVVQRYDGSLRCLYEIYKVGSTYCFRNAATGLFIDDWYCRTATGTKMAAVYYNGCNAQQFYLTKVSGSSSSSQTSGAAVRLNVPSFKQYDGRWGNLKISTKTLSQIGCVVTSAAMIYSYKTGSTVYPDAMKSRLSFTGNNLYWNSLTSLGFSTRSYNSTMTNSILSTIYAQLKAGHPVIIGADRGGGNCHYVVVTGYTGSSTSSFNAANFTINDPNSDSRTNLAQFLSIYPTVVRLVY